MKSTFKVAVAISMIMSLGVYAAPSKTTTGKASGKTATIKKSAKKSVKTPNKKSVVAKPAAKKFPFTRVQVASSTTVRVAQTQPSTYQTYQSNGSGKSAIAAPVTQPAAPAKRASARIIDRAFVPMHLANGQYDRTVPANDQDIQAMGLMSLRLGYKLTDSASVGLGTDVEHSYGSLNTGKATWTPADVFASIAHSKLTTLPGDIGVKGSFRFYAPTSEASQAAGQIARLRANVTLNRQFGPVNLYYSADPQYYIQEYLTATKLNADGTEDHSGTRSFRLYHYAGLEVQITPAMTAYSNLGLDQGWFNDDPNFKLKKNTKPNSGIYAETGLTYKLTDNISMAGGVMQDSNPDMLAQQPNKEGPLYRDELSAYFLEGTLSF